MSGKRVIGRHTIELNPAVVLKNPALWDEETIAWAQKRVVDQEWDDYEEDGPQDLETTLDNAVDRAFQETLTDTNGEPR